MRKKEVINQIKALESDLELLKDELERIEKSEDLERVSFEIELYRKLRDFAKENNEKELNWSFDRSPKYIIFYDYNKDAIVISQRYCIRGINSIYFSSEKVAKKAIEKFNNDLLKYFRGE